MENRLEFCQLLLLKTEVKRKCFLILKCTELRLQKEKFCYRIKLKDQGVLNFQVESVLKINENFYCSLDLCATNRYLCCEIIKRSCKNNMK